MRTLTFFQKTIFSTWATLAALFLLLGSYAIAEELPDKPETPPTGYVEEAPAASTTAIKGSDNLFFHFDTDLFYTYSDASNSETLHGWGVSAMIAPTYKFAEGAFVSLLYSGSYIKKRELYAADSGYKARAENQHHTITPIVRVDFGEEKQFTIKPHAFFTRDQNKDTDDADWDDGLYNYDDIGGGVDFKMRGLASEEAEGIVTLGFQIYKRDYVNYTSLLDIAQGAQSGLNLETDEKDYLGLILNADYEWTQELGLNFAVDYSLLIKWLDDKKVADINGVLSGEEQEDFLHMFETRFWYYTENGFRLGLDGSIYKNDSNQNYYEGFMTLALGDDIYTADYYDYFQYKVMPSISFQFKIVPLLLFANYSYQKLEYDDRFARNASGSAYLTDKHYETEKASTLGARYAFNDNWSVFCMWEHVDVSSNNKYEAVYQYNYWTDAYTAGLSIKF